MLLPMHQEMVMSMGVMMNAPATTPKKFKALLIDDDQLFGRVMSVMAETAKVDLEYHESLSEMGSVGLMGKYDVIICDFFLESLVGSEVAEYVDIFFGHTPMVIVSGDARVAADKSKWPPCVKGFIHKKGRPDLILKKALVMAGLS